MSVSRRLGHMSLRQERVLVVGVILALLGAGCGSGGKLGAKALSQQSKSLQSEAAEGALLAQDAVSGKTTRIATSAGLASSGSCPDPDAPIGALERKVVSESGQRLGRVHDVRGELAGGRLRVTGLIAGKLGILERYGVATQGSGGPGQAKVHGHPVIPWERVVHVGSEIVIRY